jgi:predicted glutamine amidotransferase
VSHLVAYFGNEPENLACALFSARPALARGGARDRSALSHGFGLGFVQAGDVLLQKRPRTDAADVDLYGLAKDTRADALIGRVGLSHDGNTLAEDADPFRFRSWLFGSIGDVPEAAFEAVRERILESTPAFLRRNIRGHSPSEHLFHLFLAFLHDAGILDQPTPAPAAALAALQSSLTLVDQLLAAEGAAPLQLALAATNGRCFAAASYGYPMRYLDVEGISDCPVCQARDDRSNGHRAGRRVRHESLRAFIVEATREEGARAGWRNVPDRSALIAGPDRIPQLASL